MTFWKRCKASEIEGWTCEEPTAWPWEKRLWFEGNLCITQRRCPKTNDLLFACLKVQELVGNATGIHAYDAQFCLCVNDTGAFCVVVVVLGSTSFVYFQSFKCFLNSVLDPDPNAVGAAHFRQQYVLLCFPRRMCSLFCAFWSICQSILCSICWRMLLCAVETNFNNSCFLKIIVSRAKTDCTSDNLLIRTTLRLFLLQLFFLRFMLLGF